MVPAGEHLTFRAAHDEHGRGYGGARNRSGACLGGPVSPDRRGWSLVLIVATK